MTTTTMFGYLAGFLTTISFLPQVVKTWKSRSASDLSLGMFSVFFLGVVFWLIYGLLLQESPIIFWNVITLALVLAILVMKFKFDS
ncbi:MAG: SemiSWEET transporter [Nitrospinaceae bacterium]|jgi:MtN3 and saliva related transmembrane protein|nr:SemiSWEET transporter [Nitrospina sp.]MBT5867567.1 SemiSWEET transporter [Nitrospinaceae bacterium]